jgi:hypothetical protein
MTDNAELRRDLQVREAERERNSEAHVGAIRLDTMLRISATGSRASSPPPPFRKRSVPAPSLKELRLGRADDLLRPERRLSLDGGMSRLSTAARGVVGVAPLPEGHMNPRLELRAVCALLSRWPAQRRA